MHSFKNFLFVLWFWFCPIDLWSSSTTSTNSNNDNRYQELQAFAKVLNLIERHYVEPLEVKSLIQGAIKGMLKELDPHSAYLTSDKFKEFESESKGEFGGIGIEITIDNGYLTIIAPLEDTPAFFAGLKPKDRIIAINGLSTKGFTLTDASQKLKGKVGEKVVLTIQRENEKPFDVTIVRTKIKLKSVKVNNIEHIYLYTKITKFIESTAADLENALRNHLRKNQHIAGLILDLRSNPGGLLEQATKVVDMFLPENKTIFSTKVRNKTDNYESKTTNRNPKYLDFPIIVLIDSGSASASEIVAGALQDHKRALLMGQKSFGKGSVQSIINLEDGSALKLTVARYYTPSGRSIQAEGITPDLWTQYNDLETTSADKTKTKKPIREKDFSQHLKNDKDQGTPEPETPWYGNDPILNQAINYLKVLNYVSRFSLNEKQDKSQ
ncbi:MAG: S41 family peptidase [Pseudobdellovibrionaceae bacterium]|nr:S41 family peptidase [Pseudobdellovibrionaceae bacterium]